MGKSIFKLITIIIVLSLIFNIIVFADSFDFEHKIVDTKNYSFLEVVSSKSILLDIVSNKNSYLIEGNDGLNYEFDKVIALTESGKTFSEAIESLKPYIRNEVEIKAEAIIIGDRSFENNYVVIIYNGEVEEVEHLILNNEKVNFRIVDGFIRVDSVENVTSMKLIIDGQNVDVRVGMTIDEEMSSLLNEVENLNQEDYLEHSWSNLQESILLSEESDRERILKIQSINEALDNLVEKVQFLGTFDELYYENKEFEGYKGIESLPLSNSYNICIDKEKLEKKGVNVSDDLVIKMELNGKYLLDYNYSDTFSHYYSNNISYYVLPQVNETINNWTEITSSNLGVLNDSVSHPGKIYIFNEK